MKKATLFSVIFLAIGFISGLLNDEATMSWYNTLDKPYLTPPDFVFPIAWSILYVMIGIAFAFVLKSGNKNIITTFIINIILNFSWSPIFFGARELVLSLIVIIFMIISLAYILYFCKRENRIALYLLLPYFIWICFASYLNFYITINN